MVRELDPALRQVSDWIFKNGLEDSIERTEELLGELVDLAGETGDSAERRRSLISGLSSFVSASNSDFDLSASFLDNLLATYKPIILRVNKEIGADGLSLYEGDIKVQGQVFRVLMKQSRYSKLRIPLSYWAVPTKLCSALINYGSIPAFVNFDLSLDNGKNWLRKTAGFCLSYSKPVRLMQVHGDRRAYLRLIRPFMLKADK